jgi:hypothetical protein
MSADNGIYIAKFPTTTGGVEYRVTHAQAIENTDYEEYVRSYFEDAAAFDNVSEAREHAFALEAEILADDYCPILEYGICSLEFPKPLTEYPKAPATKELV